MRYIALILVLFSAVALADDESYLKITSSPSYPKPGAGVERTIQIIIKPMFPSDADFEQIYKELSDISVHPESKTIPMHVRTIEVEAKRQESTLKAIYSVESTQSNKQLQSQWTHLFKLIREVSNEQLNPCCRR